MVMVPRSINSVKAQIRDVQEKMDRHKQLMDRYLRADTGLSVDDMRGNTVVLRTIYFLICMNSFCSLVWPLIY